MRVFLTGTWGFLLCLSLESCASAAVIELLDRATVEAATVIRLKDVARVADADAEKRSHLEDIILSPAPLAGRTTRLTYDDIRGRLLAHGVNLTHIEMRGRSQVLVTGHATGQPKVSAPQETKAQQETKPRVVAEPFPVSPPRISELEHRRANELLVWAFRRDYQPLTVPPEALLVRCECQRNDVPKVLAASRELIRFNQPQLSAGGPHAISAWWPLPDGQHEVIPVQVWLETAPQVLALKHPVPKGYVLHEEDLVWMTVNEHVAGLTRIADVVGKETTRALRPGQALQAGDLAAVPLVRAGEIVTVSVRRPGMVVRRHFKAVTAGGLHETVTLTPLDDPRVKVQAVVTGYHEAVLGSVPLESPTNPQSATATRVPASAVSQGGLP